MKVQGKIWRFVIDGKPWVKKNSKRIIRNPRHGTPQIVSSKQAIRCEKDAVVQLRSQWIEQDPIAHNVVARFWVYLGERQNGDLSNYLEGPKDALQKAGVLANDQRIWEQHEYRLRDRERPRVEIEIEVLP